jgi:hypothetical protein
MRELVIVVVFFIGWCLLSNEDYLVKVSDEKQYCKEVKINTFFIGEDTGSCNATLKELHE